MTKIIKNMPLIFHQTLQNILGIADISGKIVVKYEYELGEQQALSKILPLALETSFVILAAKVGYFVAESIANEAITKWFE